MVFLNSGTLKCARLEFSGCRVKRNTDFFDCPALSFLFLFFFSFLFFHLDILDGQRGKPELA